MSRVNNLMFYRNNPAAVAFPTIKFKAINMNYCHLSEDTYGIEAISNTI